MKCQCADPGCQVHVGVNYCLRKSDGKLYRIDMDDETGTEFCDFCADDALDSGLYSVQKSDGRDEEEE